MLLEESSKAKRSVVDEKTMQSECQPFTIGDDTTKTFESPGYPGHYTKNISCVRVLEGKKTSQYYFQWCLKSKMWNAVDSVWEIRHFAKVCLFKHCDSRQIDNATSSSKSSLASLIK